MNLYKEIDRWLTKIAKSRRHKKAIGKWEVRRCCWPYPQGYATYNPVLNMILDTGLTKEEAQDICNILNKRKSL